jgi:hypothetical protein
VNIIKEAIMEEERKRLLETYEKLDPLNRAKVLARADLIYGIQESTKRRMIELLVNHSPQYRDRHDAPMGALKEAVNA